ncbi:hypothetical protein LCGC14_1258490 [marine sediment metagenome]|uniref:Uncharacterized protein n=1 Tax=marine sediment metagenome TaxID=412755 RepID=A0A0F9P4T2_9ZZZZ
MGKYIDITEIPRGRRESRWPYELWATEIPTDQALEITDQLNGQKTRDAASVINTFIAQHPQLRLSIKPVQRGERLWVVKVPNA